MPTVGVLRHPQADEQYHHCQHHHDDDGGAAKRRDVGIFFVVLHQRFGQAAEDEPQQ